VRRGACAGAALALALALAAAVALPLLGLGSSASRASEAGPATPMAQPVIGVPLEYRMTLIGSSPQEAAGETWGYGSTAAGFQIVRYTPKGGWQLQPTPRGAHGEALSGFAPAGGPLAGSVTPDGGVAIVGRDHAGVGQVLVRDPRGAFGEAPTLSAEPEGGPAPGEPNALLSAGETLPETLSAVDLPGGRTGVFLVPLEGGSAAGAQEEVLFYNGTEKVWAREPICIGVPVSPKAGEPCTKPAHGFQVLALGASSPQDAWLLALNASGPASEGMMLFRREAGAGEPRWVQRPLGAPGSLGARLAQQQQSYENAAHETYKVHIAPLANGQPLTVTGQGVWVDGQLRAEGPGLPASTASVTLYYDLAKGTVSGSWCSIPHPLTALPAWRERPLCTQPLEASLPTGAYRSFAWTGDGEYGQRVITGLADGLTLSLHGQSFAPVLGAGGESGGSFGAAFSSPEEGWLAEELGPLTHLSTAPLEPDRVQSWPVAFRHPLAAIATQPGAVPGELAAQAIAVGQDGQVAHYTPGQGWVPEALLTSSGQPKSPAPELRGVAWPEADRAYAVGTHGAMWVWRAETGLWEPDPARPQNLFLPNFTGIAFAPGDPARGYAIGQQGTLLAFGKSWEQEPLPTGLAGAEGANFTSIAFAGGEALVTYQVPEIEGARTYSGGVLCNNGDGSGWHIDTALEAALGSYAVPERVAGLPDGGAAIATSQGTVIERAGPGSSTACQEGGSPWQAAPAGPVDGFPVALAAFREGGALRAVVSIEPSFESFSRDLSGDEVLRKPSPGQPPVITPPYTLPASGYLLRETATGWRDEEHEDFPAPSLDNLPAGQGAIDWPIIPDSVLALALSPNGEQGWAVGGQSGEINRNGGGNSNIEAVQTAGVMRYPATGAPPSGFSVTPEKTSSANATFAIGGGAQCVSDCADLAGTDIGPDKWLQTAIARAGETQGVRDFLYSGPRLPPGANRSPSAFLAEESRYGELLSSPSETMAVFAAPTESDLDAEGNLNLFDLALGAHELPLAESPPPPAGKHPFAFESAGVWVVMLDYSGVSLGSEQQCWLARQLADARERRMPTIVIGNRGVGDGFEGADAGQVAGVLDGDPPAGCALESASSPGYASAYFFDSGEQNRAFTIAVPGQPPLHVFGSGTLGYVRDVPGDDFEFLGASGFLVAEVQRARATPGTSEIAPVHVRLVPDIGDLALDATDGVLLPRSHPALFDALARRPRAGMVCADEAGACTFDPNPYVPIPSRCQGADCATGILPAYTFTSSNPDIGQFVEADPASPEGTNVLQSAHGKPIPDEPRSAQGELTPSGQFQENAREQPLNERGEVVPRAQSALFCAYNAGTTTVTVHAGGLSSSEQVTVRGGSVEQPCGTVPLRNPPPATAQTALAAPPPPPIEPAPETTPSGALTPPPAPAPRASAPTPVIQPKLYPPPRIGQPQKREVKPPPPFVRAPALLIPVLATVLPPPPPTPRPTPPSGTAEVPAQSPVSQPVGAAEAEEQEEAVTEHVHNAAAYTHEDQGPMPGWPLGLVLVAAAAGMALGPRVRARSRRAYAHTSTAFPTRAGKRPANPGGPIR